MHTQRRFLSKAAAENTDRTIACSIMSDAGWTTVTSKPKPKPKPAGGSSGVQQPWQSRPAASSSSTYGAASTVQKKCE